jgi:hypothetical protein
MSCFMRARQLALLSIVMAGVGATGAGATPIIFDLGSVITGGTPAGTAPWLRATLQDIAPGVVRLTMETTGLVRKEKVGSWWFSVDQPGLVDLSFRFVTGTEADHIAFDPDELSPPVGTAGFFDVEFAFPTSGKAFESGKAVYDITGVGAILSASSFATLSSGGSRTVPFHSVAHVLGLKAQNVFGLDGSDIGDGPLEAFATPEPSPLALLALAGLAAAALRRRLPIV